jgi:hypothetical protein
MANVGQTVFRFAGALLLAAGATAVDRALAGDDNPPRPRESEANAPAPLPPYPFRLTDRKIDFPLRFTDYAFVGRFITPESRVNVLVKVQDPDDPAAATVTVLMKNVRVREIRHPAEPVRGTPDVPVAMLEVTSDDAEMLRIAQSVGVVGLVPADSTLIR